THHDPGVHRRRQQSRAGHRGGDRDVRSRLGAGTGRGRRTADRSARACRTRLRFPGTAHQAVREESLMAGKPSVLFVCVHNAGRARMAAPLLGDLAGDRIEVRSAGPEPADQTNPAAVEAMAEIGIDIGAASPKILTPDTVQTSDVVITMGCGDTCPYFP